MALDTISSCEPASTDELSLPIIDDATCSTCHYPSWTNELLSDGVLEIKGDKFDDLRSSAEFGCSGCKILKQAWDYATTNTDDRTTESIWFNESWGNFNVYLSTQRVARDLDIFTLEHAPRFKHIRVASLIPPSTNLNVNYDKIRQWLSKCEQQHENCKADFISVPPRLLDLQSDTIGIIRIVDLRNDPSEHRIPPANLRYACLSHCWGNSRSKHLTRNSNLEKNMKGIPIAELPQTFREAVEVSQALNIRYLWIDSLCIVQDDVVHWEDHVKIMADIYRDAHITLAAGASEDDDGGFFRDPEDVHTDLRSFMVTDRETKCEIYIRRCLPHPDQGWPQGPVMPLMSRGWVFQERLLSRRFLCFARNEILWECQEDVACSCSTSDTGFNHPIPILGAKPGFLNCRPVKFEFATMFQLPKNDLWSLWRNVVVQYSRRELTYPHDKMPALAGLARHFEAAGAGIYLYGLWLEAFETDFLWMNWGISERESRPRNAPSWSWISAADGMIGWFPNDAGNSRWKVMSMPVRDTVTSRQVNDSSHLPLTVRGNVSHVSLELRDPDMPQSPGYRSVYLKPAPSGTSSLASPLNIQGHVAADLSSSKYTEKMTSQMYEGSFWADYKFWIDESSLKNLLGSVCFLEARIEDHDNPSDIDDASPCSITGLLLRSTDPAGDAIIPSFERIGFLRVDTKTPKNQWKPLGADTTFFFV